MSQEDLFSGIDLRTERQRRAAELRDRAELIHRRADLEYDDTDRRGDLRVQACALEMEADELVPVEYVR